MNVVRNANINIPKEVCVGLTSTTYFRGTASELFVNEGMWTGITGTFQSLQISL